MNSFIEGLYFRSPILFQHAAVSIYGIKLRNERYSHEGRKYLKVLLESQRLSAEKIAELQSRCFVDLARRAIKNVPYYQDWANEAHADARDINSIEQLKYFPIIDKEEVRKEVLRFVDESFIRNDSTFRLFTSGSTGTPLQVFTNRTSRSKHYAFFSRLRSWYGLPEQPRRITLFGRIIMDPENSSPPFWRYDIFNNNLLMSSYHLNHKNLNFYVQKIRAYNPEEVFSYPSSLTQIAHYIISNNLKPIRVPLVMTTAEPLVDYQRDLINRAFETKVVNQYGCTEMLFFGSECPHGVMHIHPEHGITEIIEDTEYGNGNLVATGLINDVMPLIRYRVGDNIIMSSDRCSCGLEFPVIESVDGRCDDLIFRTDGTPIGRLDPVFKGGMGIKEAKIIQNEDSSIDILLVADATFNESNKKWLISEIKKRTGNQIDINITMLEAIERERNGKFKAVVGRFKPKFKECL